MTYDGCKLRCVGVLLAGTIILRSRSCSLQEQRDQEDEMEKSMASEEEEQIEEEDERNNTSRKI